MSRTDFNTLLEAGAHFGHLKRKWNPKMAPYIFMEKNGIHIIDLHKTVLKIDEAAAAIKQIAKSGRRVLFVATKKQAKEIVAEKVATVGCVRSPAALRRGGCAGAVSLPRSGPMRPRRSGRSQCPTPAR